MGKNINLSPEKQAISERLTQEIKSKYGMKKNLAEKLNKDLSYLSRIIASGSYSTETRNILIAAGIDMNFVEGFNGNIINETVKSPSPEISPHPQSDCGKVAEELEVALKKVEYYANELEAVRKELSLAQKEISALHKDKFEMQKEITELKVDALQTGGRSAVERGKTADALEI